MIHLAKSSLSNLLIKREFCSEIPHSSPNIENNLFVMHCLGSFWRSNKFVQHCVSIFNFFFCVILKNMKASVKLKCNGVQLKCNTVNSENMLNSEQLVDKERRWCYVGVFFHALLGVLTCRPFFFLEAACTFCRIGERQGAIFRVNSSVFSWNDIRDDLQNSAVTSEPSGCLQND